MSGANETERLRKAYLDLVKRTVSNYIQLGGDARFRDYNSLAHYDVAKSDWAIPLLARPHTLLGKQKLGLIEQLLLRIESAKVPGDLIEAGVWRGGAVIFMRALLEAHTILERRVFAADTFTGIPASSPARRDYTDQWADRFVAGIDDVRSAIDRFGLLDERIVFVEGAFAETLPGLDRERFALVRLDADSFDSTCTALDQLYPLLSSGGAIIIDDWHLYGCRIAVEDFRRRHAIGGTIEVTAGNAWWIKQEAYGQPGK